MKNGHSWLSIKQYTLAEIGIFLKEVVKQEKEERFTDLSNIWLGNNLSKKGIDKVLSDYGILKPEGSREVPQSKVDSEWQRLATFMKGKK